MAQAAGANVWAASRTQEKISHAAALHPLIQFSQVDTHDPDGLKALFASVGPIDHLVGAGDWGDSNYGALYGPDR